MGSEIEETAKATGEIAKATGKALDVGEKLGGFLSKVIGQPMETAAGIVDDKLKYIRLERAARLVDRVNALNQMRGIEGSEKAVPLKLAIPALENASIEENDALQDLWARLISSAQKGTAEVEIRSAYIDIIKQLEISDVNLLQLIYNSYMKHVSEKNMSPDISPIHISFTKEQIVKILQISDQDYELSVDNLMRVRCICSAVTKSSGISVGGISPTTDAGYEAICITRLGEKFVKACVSDEI